MDARPGYGRAGLQPQPSVQRGDGRAHHEHGLRRGFQQHAAVHDLLEGLPDAVERAAPADPALLQHLHHRLSGLA